MSKMINWPTPGQLADALKSGRYNQTTGQMVQTYGSGHSAHCCLGVCAVEAGYTDEDLLDRLSLRPEDPLDNEPTSALNDYPDWLTFRRQAELIRRNDGWNDGWNRVIAYLRYIEENPGHDLEYTRLDDVETSPS